MRDVIIFVLIAALLFIMRIQIDNLSADVKALNARIQKIEAQK